jgi:thiamine kinase-like enzyme
MNASTPDTPVNLRRRIARFAQEDAASEMLESFLSGKPEVESISILKCMRFVPEKRWVFTAILNGERVVIKRIFSPDAPKIIREMKEELTYLADHFAEGPYQANKCLHIWPRRGIVVLSFVPGITLNESLLQATRTERTELLVQAGGWLSTMSQDRRRQSKIDIDQHLHKLKIVSLDHIVEEDDLALLDQLQTKLNAQRMPLTNAPLQRGSSHGDFQAHNIHAHDGTMYGVDIHGRTWMALARDVAKFLAYLQMKNGRTPNAGYYGINQSDWDAFLSNGPLGQEEHHTILPFMIGERFYRFYTEFYDNTSSRAALRTSIEAYLQDC